MRILRLYWSPIREFESLKEDPAWRCYFVILCIGSVIMGWLLQPYVEHVSRIQLERVFSSSEARSALESSAGWKMLGMLFVPCFFLVKASLFGGVAWAIAGVFGAVLEFRKAFTVVMASSTVLLAKGFTALAVLSLRGKEDLVRHADLRPELGLDLLISVTDPFWGTVLRSFTIFEVSYVLLLATGFSILGNLAKSTGFAAALVVLFLGVYSEAKLESIVAQLNRFLS